MLKRQDEKQPSAVLQVFANQINIDEVSSSTRRDAS